MKKNAKTFTSFLALAAVVILLQSCAGNRTVETSATYNVPADEAQKVDHANSVLRDFVAKTGTNIPPEVLQNAAGIVIIPDVTRAAFIAGARHGTGVLTSRQENQWSLPVFASITGGSVGLQAGISSTDVLLVFREREAITNLQKGASYTLGSDLGVTAGPVGATADLTTYDAPVLAYRRTEGAFAGVSLTGSRLNIEPETTYDYYAGARQARGYYAESGEALVADILNQGGNANIQTVPPNAEQLRETLNQVTNP